MIPVNIYMIKLNDCPAVDALNTTPNNFNAYIHLTVYC